jgi:hypothetical protein
MASPVRRITYRSVKRVTSLCALAVVSTLLLGGDPAWGAQLVAELTASDKQPGGADFGRSVGISGDYIVVGAPYDSSDMNQDRGAVYVFKRSGAAWVEQAKLIGSQAGWEDCMGWSVAIDGDVLVAGAPDCEVGICLDFGAAYVFRRTVDTWVEEAKLVPSGSTQGDNFGQSVAISGERIIVGASNFCGLGHAYVFRWTGTGWIEEAALSGSDTVPEDYFGSGVDIAGDLLIAGAPSDDAPANDSGSAYVFRRSGVSWSEEGKLTLPAPLGNEHFGWSVAVLTVDQVAVGAPWDALRGSVTVFQRDAGVWARQAKLVASDPARYDRFGSALAAGTGSLLVCNPDYDGQLPDRGSVYVFHSSGTEWYKDCKVPSPEPAETPGRFGGWAVAVDGETAGISGYGYPNTVYVYRLDPCIPALSEWGVGLMGLALLITGAICMRRRKSFCRGCLVASHPRRFGDGNGRAG